MSPDKIQINNVKRQVDLIVSAADDLPDYALRYLCSVLSARKELQHEIQWRSDQAGAQTLLKYEAERATNTQIPNPNEVFMGGEIRRA